MSAWRLVVTVLVLATPALAAKPRVLIDAPPAIAKVVTRLLAKKYTPTPIKKSLSAEPTAKEVSSATRDFAAIAVVQARLEGKEWSVRVLNGADGTPLTTIRFKNAKRLVPPASLGPKLKASLKDASAPGADPALAAAPAPAPEKQPDSAPTTAKPTTTASKPAEPAEPAAKPDMFDDSAPAPVERPMAFRFGIGFTGFNRTYAYRDDLFSALSQYRLPFGPAAAGELEIYPGAFFSNSIAANFGVEAAFNYVIGVSSKANDVKFASASMKLHAGAVGRIPLGFLELHIGFGYALQTFSIAETASGSTRPNIPNVSFGGLRPSLQATLHFTPIFSLHFGGAYQFLLSKGEFASATYFPRAVGGGADMWVGVGIRPISHFEIRVQGDYTRYFFSLKPQVGDPYIAGGALDQYLSGTITANVIF